MGNGSGDDRRMVASCYQWAVAFAPPDVGFPADVLAHLGVFCEAPWQRSAALGRRALGPGAFHKRASGMGGARFGERAVVASLPGGRFRRDQPQALQQGSWGLNTGPGANVGDQGDGHRALHATESPPGFAPRVHTPGVHVCVERRGATLAACSVCGDRTAICVEHALLGRRRADDRREPPARGRAPMRPAGGAESVLEQEGWEAKLGVLARAEGIFTGAGESAHRGIVHGGDRHDRESPRAGQPGQVHRLSAVGVDAVTRLVGPPRRCHAPAVSVFFGPRAL
jgi:hypothetical protein